MNKKLVIGLASATLALGAVASVKIIGSGDLKADAFAPSGETYTLYVEIGDEANGWKSGNERYAMNYFGGADGWVDLENVNGFYKAVIPSAATKAIVCRMNGATVENKWGNEWNQTHDITLSDKIGYSDNTIYVKEEGYGKNNYSWEERQPELTPGKAYLRGNWEYGWCDVSKEMAVDGSTLSISNVLLSKNSQVKAVTINADYSLTWYDATDVGGNSDATFESPNVVINTTGNYNISVNTSTKVYTIDEHEDPDFTAAVDFANDFKDSMQLYCPVHGTDEEHKGADKLASEWSAFQTRFNDSGTTEQTRTYLKTLDDATINEFHQRYNQILSDYYSLLKNYDFLDMATALSLSKSTNVFELNKESNVLPIAIIAASALVSAGAFFLLRRKSEN